MKSRILSAIALLSFSCSLSAQFSSQKNGVELILNDYTKIGKTILEQYKNNKKVTYQLMLCNDKCNSDFYVIHAQIINNAKHSVSILPSSVNMPFLSKDKAKSFFGIDSYSYSDFNLFLKFIGQNKIIFSTWSIVEIIDKKYKGYSFFDLPNKKINWLNYPCTSVILGLGGIYAGHYFYTKVRDNNRITKCYKKWLLEEKTVIQPRESVRKLFIINKNDFKSKFDLHIYNEDASKVINTFKVSLG